MTFGGGSIKKNGVYDQVVRAMQGRQMTEFGGIEPNPQYETCLKAVEQVRAAGIDFLLAVGGGSVLDATKFVAAAVRYKGKEAVGHDAQFAGHSRRSLAAGLRA